MYAIILIEFNYVYLANCSLYPVIHTRLYLSLFIQYGKSSSDMYPNHFKANMVINNMLRKRILFNISIIERNIEFKATFSVFGMTFGTT